MNYSIKPEAYELEAAERVVEQTLESCQYVLEKEEKFEVNLGAFPGDYGASGEALAGSLQLYFNTDRESWRQQLKKAAVDSYGRSWFLENREITFNWQQLLSEITGLMLLEKTGEGKQPEREGLEQEWKESKEALGREAEDREIFSWHLKALLGRKLLEENRLEEFPELKKSDVEEAGEELFE